MSRMSRRTATLPVLLLGALVVGGCSTVYVGDLTFERARLVPKSEHAALPLDLRRFVANVEYPYSDMIEVTLSTSRNLSAVMQRNDAWILTVQARQCGPADKSAQITEWYHRGKGIASPDVRYGTTQDAKPEEVVAEGGRYFYQFYISARDIDRPNWEQAAYDLPAAPFDVCATVGARAFARTIELDSNIVTIPAETFAGL